MRKQNKNKLIIKHIISIIFLILIILFCISCDNNVSSSLNKETETTVKISEKKLKKQNRLNGSNQNIDKKVDEEELEINSVIEETEEEIIYEDSVTIENSEIIDDKEPTYRNGYISYQNKVFMTTHYDEKATKDFLAMIDIFHQYFKSSRMIFIPVPSSLILIEDKKIKGYYASTQNTMIDIISKMAEDIHIDEDIRTYVVNPCDEIEKHRDEYLYFYYDGHWTSRGAYYAYKALCDFLNVPCRKLSEYREVLLNDDFKGAELNKFKKAVGDKVKLATDKLYAYISPTKSVKTLYNAKGKNIGEYSPIDEKKDSYWGAFTSNDNPYAIIRSEIKSDKKALVIKDSFGPVFIPYLTDIYSEIYIMDMRFTYVNPISRFKDVEFDDIIFINSIYEAGYGNLTRKINKIIDDYIVETSTLSEILTEEELREFMSSAQNEQ